MDHTMHEPSPPTQKTTRDHTPTRRQVVTGLSWSVPAVAAGAAAPAFAASPPPAGYVLQTVTWQADKNNEVIRSVRIPAFARQVTYTIIGGSSGSGPKLDWGQRGGNGAVVSGRIQGPGEGTPQAAEYVLYGIAGGGSASAAWTVNSQPRQSVISTGYGNGGASLGGVYISSVYVKDWSQRWNVSGGAGSALSIGACPGAGGQLVAVAGGGGAAGSGTYGREAARPRQWGLRDGLGLGGDSALNGADGGTTGVGVANADVYAEGGRGAAGGTGGRGGTAASTRLILRSPASSSHLTQLDGLSGGSHGTGRHGGGDGGSPVQFNRESSTLVVVSGAGGGGGYAGGGSSAVIGAEVGDAYRIALTDYRDQLGAGGGGGGGSSYLNPALGAGFSQRETSVVAATGRAGQHKDGSVWTPVTEEQGRPGEVSISFYVPADRAVSNPTAAYVNTKPSC